MGVQFPVQILRAIPAMTLALVGLNIIGIDMISAAAVERRRRRFRRLVRRTLPLMGSGGFRAVLADHPSLSPSTHCPTSQRNQMMGLNSTQSIPIDIAAILPPNVFGIRARSRVDRKHLVGQMIQKFHMNFIALTNRTNAIRSVELTTPRRILLGSPYRVGQGCPHYGGGRQCHPILDQS